MSEDTPPKRPPTIGNPAPHQWIPSPVTLLALPDAALQLVQKVRDYLPGDLPPAPAPADAEAALADRISDRIGLSAAVGVASVALRLLRLVRAEVGSGIVPTRMRGWDNPLLVWAGLNKLDLALKGLVGHLGWGELDGAAGVEIENKGCVSYGKNGKPLETPPGVAKIAASTPPVPASLLDALERAAERLSRELRPTLERTAAKSRPSENKAADHPSGITLTPDGTITIPSGGAARAAHREERRILIGQYIDAGMTAAADIYEALKRDRSDLMLRNRKGTPNAKGDVFVYVESMVKDYNLNRGGRAELKF